MKKTTFTIALTILVLLTVGVLAVLASEEITVPHFIHSCSSTGQLCTPVYDFPFTTSGGLLKAQYDVPVGAHCSSIRIHFWVDGAEVATSGWLGYYNGLDTPQKSLPKSTGLINLGLISGGSHTLGIQAEGQFGGCNGGTLGSWAGEGKIVVSPIEVTIDIKPGSFPNCFNSDGHGVIPVAILGSPDFDPSTVNPFSVELDGQAVRVKGKSGNAGSLEDVNGDGILDLVVQITDEGGFSAGDTIATITGATYDGIPILGSDTICLKPPE